MDDLNRRITAVLAKAELPQEAWAVERIREDVKIALDCAHDVAALALPLKEALAVSVAAKALLRLARDYKLESDGNLAVVRRLGTQANFRLARGGKPVARAWLGPCVENFRGTWEALTDRPSGMYYADDASPALVFVTDCSALVDPSVNPSAVKRAYDEFRQTRTMTDEEYAEFWQSDFWQEVRRSGL
jgi:hypothetical protein